MMATYTGKEPFAIFSRWVAKEICDVLGITETMTVIERLDEDESGKTRKTLVGNNGYRK